MRQNIEGCISNGLMITELAKLFDTKLSIQMHHASVCGTTVAAFGLDTIPVNAAFHSALSNNKVVNYQEIWSGMQFRIMGDPICYELRLISKPTGTFVKFYRPKSFSSSMVTLELSFIRIMHVLQLEKTNFGCAYKQWGNSLPETGIQNLFDFMPCPIAALNAVRGGYQILNSDTEFIYLFIYFAVKVSSCTHTNTSRYWIKFNFILMNPLSYCICNK